MPQKTKKPQVRKNFFSWLFRFISPPVTRTSIAQESIA